MFRGDSVLARDELSPLDEHGLTLEGIDVDTLPASESECRLGWFPVGIIRPADRGPPDFDGYVLLPCREPFHEDDKPAGRACDLNALMR